MSAPWRSQYCSPARSPKSSRPQSPRRYETRRLLLVALYIVFVAAIWIVERQPPALGETAELQEAGEQATRGRIGRELVLVVAGVAAMAIGASLLVEAIRQISGVEASQARLGLIVVGFATAFELVVLAWSSARHGMTSVVVAGVIGPPSSEGQPPGSGVHEIRSTPTSAGLRRTQAAGVLHRAGH